MKILIVIFFIFSVLFVQAQAPDPEFNDKLGLIESRGYQKSATFIESDENANYDLVYQKLRLKVDPAINFIEGSVCSTIKILKENISKVHFDLTNSLTVDSVKCDYDLTKFIHAFNEIEISLPKQSELNNISYIEIFYHGSPPNSGFGSFIVSTHNAVPVMWTLSEPYGAKDWWPCKESLTDKIDSLDFYITNPPQYMAASNGRLISDQIVSDKRIAHWQHRYPIATYLVGFAVTNYEAYSDYLDLSDGKRIEILNYVYPEYLVQAKTNSENTLNILDFYNSKFITYPFAKEKYGHAQFGWGGGMEHQTMSFMANLGFELVAHEMAHQWFGDYITVGSWHDIWLNEGFATYLTGLTYENLLKGTYWSDWKNNQVKNITSVPNGSVYVADTTSVSRIFSGRLSYSKGAYLLHMLRWEMGDEKFFNGMKNYLNDPAVANKFASQKQFVKHMETAADTVFTEFFKDWYYGEGYPVFHLNYYTDYGDNGKIKLRVSQSSSDPSVAFFEMHVPVRVWRNGKSSDLRLYNTTQDQKFTISEVHVDSIQFDPDKWLIARSDKVLPVINNSEYGEIRIITVYNKQCVRIILPNYKGNETIRIFDLSGRIVRNDRLIAGDSEVDFSNLKNGIYLIEVQSNLRKAVEKILINR